MAVPFIPDHFWSVAYAGACIPDGSHDLSAGANCQTFAFALLAANGLDLPPFRSSDLWADDIFTLTVRDLRPLDLLLFHNRPDAWGAHVAIHLTEGRAIHLAKFEGKPEIWPLDRFGQDPRYWCFIGAKRVRSLGAVRV